MDDGLFVVVARHLGSHPASQEEEVLQSESLPHTIRSEWVFAKVVTREAMKLRTVRPRLGELN